MGAAPSAKPAVKRASPAENQAVIPDPEQGNRIGPESVGRLSICGNRTAFSNATLPTVRGCVDDFETAKLRRGVQACLQPDRAQDDCKLFNEFSP